MLIKTSELTGAALDWAVTKCELELQIESGVYVKEWVLEEHKRGERFSSFSTEWDLSGPIIEGYCINLFRLDPKTEEDTRFWLAHIDGIYCSYGVSALTAAMRCYVASRLGDSVEVPEGLTC